MTRVAVVYHSASGRTGAQAERVLAGAARVPGVSCELLSVEAFDDAGAGPAWAALDGADAIVLGCPTFMGGPSASMKAFMDASSSRWGRRVWRDKLGAGFTNAGAPAGDQLHTLTSLAVFAAQHAMLWIGQGAPPEAGPGDPPVNRAGAWMGLTGQADPDASRRSPLGGDLLAAELFGERVALAARRWANSRHSPTTPP